MSEVIDATGRWILTDEPCRSCGRLAKEMHPAGVVSGRWTCTSCGRVQSQNVSTSIGKTNSGATA
jgi:transposase-like protein